MQKLTVHAKGLYTFPNQVSEVPNGSLVQADNVVIDREGVIEPRRGYNLLPGVLGSTSTHRANQIFRYRDNVIAHYGPLGVPTTLAFYAPSVSLTGLETTSTNTLTNLSSVSGLYVGQYVTINTVEQAFTGTTTIGSNVITLIPSTKGLYVGQLVGGLGIAAGATISSITGTGPFTMTISSNATYTKANNSLTASNSNLLGLAAGTTITVVGTTSVTLSNSASVSSRSLTFAPSDVDVTQDLISISINGLVNGQSVQFSSTGTLPSGLTAGTIYYLVNVTDTDFQVSATSGGAAINLTTQGTGTHTLKVQVGLSAYGWINYTGTYNQPGANTKIRSAEVNNNVYFTTSIGIQRLDSITSAITPAGAPKGLDGYAALDNATTGFMPTNVQAAYRVVWGIEDLNKNTHLGVPSQRILIANTSGSTKDVDLNITIPQEVTTDHFFQVYRSGFSADATSEPNDEMALVYEANPNSTDISNGYVTITDRTPESLRNGASLYTNPSQEGILQANEPPPFANDVTLFKGSTFYANTKTKQNLTLSILSVSSQFDIKGDTTSTGADTPTTIRNLTYTVTGTVTSGSSQITAVSNVASLYVGQTISDATNSTYLPSGTVITQIVSSSVIQVSNNAIGSGVGDTLTIGLVGVAVGQSISGTGIPASTTVSQVYTASTSAGDTGNTSTTITNIASTAVFKVGQPISGTGISSNTVVASIVSSTSITISKAATATNTGVALTLGNGLQISNSATATNTGTTLTLKNGSLGIQLNDTLTVAGTTYTAKLVENIASKQFRIFAQGSPAQNIADTANSLVRVVNRTTTPTPTVYATYLSGFNDLPGKMLFQERVFGGGTFYATASSTGAGAAYSPNLPASGTAVSSQNDQFSNGLYFSKNQQPEAVPLLNFVKVGSANAAILRVIPLRDSLFILKEDGIFRLTGTDPSNFSVDLFDSTTQILAAESAVSLNNLIFMFTKYGIVTVSDTGVTVISRAIEDKMLDLLEVDLNKAKNLSFGISYESDRKYIFFCVTANSDLYATQAYVYNTFTNTWTRWSLSQTCGIVTPLDDVLYLGDVTTNSFDIERKERNFTDYMDSSFGVTLLSLTGTTTSGSSTVSSISDTSAFEVGQSVSGIGIPDGALVLSVPSSTTITLNTLATASGTTTLLLDSGKTLILSSLLNISVGDVLWQTNSRFSIITAINQVNVTITVRDQVSWVLGASTILKGFKSVVKYVPQTASNPGQIKQFREATLLFQVPYFNKISLGFDTDLSSGVQNIPLQSPYGTQWGRFKWGRVSWGGTIKPLPIRTYVPQQKQRCSLLNVTLTHQEAYSFYRLNGISFIHNNLSERVGK